MQMTDLPGSLQELEELWRRGGVPIEELFGPGLNPATARSMLQGAGLRPVAEAIEWFSWHNGAGPARRSDPWLGPTPWTALSLTEALEARASRFSGAIYAAEHIDRNTLPSHWWDESWLPIADNGGQGTLTINLSEFSESVAVRSVNWSDEDFRTVREDSLKDLVDVWITIIRRGGWTWSGSLKHWQGDFSALPMELRGRSLM
jgi:hypothetical protein